MTLYIALSLVFVISAAICLWQYWHRSLTDDITLSDDWPRRLQ